MTSGRKRKTLRAGQGKLCRQKLVRGGVANFEGERHCQAHLSRMLPVAMGDRFTPLNLLNGTQMHQVIPHYSTGSQGMGRIDR